MALVVAALTGAEINSGSDASSYTVASATYTSGRYYLLGVANCKATTPDVVNSASNAHVTFASLVTVTYDLIATPTKRISIWGGAATSTGAATLPVDFNSVTQLGCNAAVLEVTGHNTTTPVRVGANRVSNAADNVASGASFTITLDSALASTLNAIVAFCGMNSNSGMTAENSYNEVYDNGHGTPASMLHGMWLINGGTPTCTKTSAAANIEYGGVAVELNEASVGGATHAHSKIWGISKLGGLVH